MKKVQDVPNFLSPLQVPTPPPSSLLSQRPPSPVRANFFQQLVKASLPVGRGEGQVTQDNAERVPPLSLDSTNLLDAVTLTPSQPEFFPSKNEDDLQFFPISNPENPSNTKAIFPQNEKEDDEIVFITEKPQVNELNNLGFQSPAPVPQTHIVRSQLVVGDQMTVLPPEQDPTFPPTISPERQKAKDQLEQLEQLEELGNW